MYHVSKKPKFLENHFHEPLTQPRKAPFRCVSCLLLDSVLSNPLIKKRIQFLILIAPCFSVRRVGEANGTAATTATHTHRESLARESSTQPEIQLSGRFESEFMTRRAGETLTEYRDRRLESTSPSRYNSSGSSALEFQSRTDFGARESSAPASYLSRVNRLTDTSSSGTDGGGAGRRTSDAVNATPAGSSRRQKFKDSRAHTAELGALIESMDNQGRRGSGQDSLDGEVQ